MHKILTTFLFIINSSFLFALNQDQYNATVHKINAIKNKQVPASEVVTNFFEGVDKKQVAYTRFAGGSGDKGAIVIAVGRSESSIAYYDTAMELIDRGYSPLFVLDHRGQGFSERLLKDTEKSHVEDFNHYAQDFSFFIKEIVLKEVGEDNLFVLAHSMGAAVVANSLLNDKKKIDAIVYSAPMFKINLPDGELNTLTQLNYVCNLFVDWMGFCNQYVPGGTGYKPDVPFEMNRLTSDPIRYRLIYKYYELWPETQVGSATMRWLRESILATQKIRGNSNRLDYPTLILQAGADSIVNNEGQDEYCTFSLLCQVMRFPTSKHSILSESSHIRELAFDTLDDFFQIHGQNIILSN